MKKNILLLESLADEAMALLRAAPSIAMFEDYKNNIGAGELLKHPIHAIITRGKGQVNSDMINNFNSLELIARCGVGLENIAISEATNRQIPVIHTPNANAATMAEHTIALMLLLQRNVYGAISELRMGNWQFRNDYQGDEVHGKLLGILGMGNIGARVAHIASALGMQVVYWNRGKKDVPYDYLDLNSLLKQADILSIHLPSTDDTHHLINEKAFLAMKNKALLINTARGRIVDQASLLSALEGGLIAGYAADVMSTEPPDANDLLLRHPKTLITPHIGSLTSTTYKEMSLTTANNVLALLRGDEIPAQYINNRHELMR